MDQRPRNETLRPCNITATDEEWETAHQAATRDRMQLRAWIREAMAEKAARPEEPS